MEPRLLGTQRILNFPKCSCHGQSHSHHHDDQDQDEMNEVIEVSIHECPPALRHDFKLVFPSVQLQPPPSSSLSSSSSSSRRLLVVPTFQRATCSLLATGDLPESEKDRLLNNVRHSLSPYPYPYSLSPAMEPPLPSSPSLSLPSSNHGACQCVAACGNLVNGQTSPTLPPVSLFVHHPLSLPPLSLPPHIVYPHILCYPMLSLFLQVLTARGPSPYPDVHGCLSLLPYQQIDFGGCTLISHPRWGTHAYPATLFTTAPFEVLRQILIPDSLTDNK